MEVAWTRVSVYAVCRDDEGRILLTRYASPDNPDHGKWTIPGGAMDWGESAADTAHRELWEETGLTATLGEIAGIFSRWFTAEDSWHHEAGQLVGIVFKAFELCGEIREEFDEGTTDAAQWFHIEEIQTLPHVELVDFVLGLLST